MVEDGGCRRRERETERDLSFGLHPERLKQWGWARPRPGARSSMRAPVGVAGAQVLRPPPAASQVHQKEAGLEAEAGLKPGHSHPSGSLACASEGPSEKTQYFTIFYNLFLFERRQGWGEQEERGRETGASADWLLNVRNSQGEARRTPRAPLQSPTWA